MNGEIQPYREGGYPDTKVENLPEKKNPRKRIAPKGISRRLYSGEIAIKNAKAGANLLLKLFPQYFVRTRFRGKLVHTKSVALFTKEDTPKSRTEEMHHPRKQHGYDKLIFGHEKARELSLSLLNSYRCIFRFSKSNVNQAKLKSAHPPAPYYPKDLMDPIKARGILKKALAPYQDAYLIWMKGSSNKKITHMAIRKIKDIPLECFRLRSSPHSRNEVIVEAGTLDFFPVNGIKMALPGYPRTLKQHVEVEFFGKIIITLIEVETNAQTS